MTNTKPLFWSAIILVFLISCRDELQVNKYERPDWLAGKVYTQILEQPELSTFAKCLEITGYDTIINVSGSYTVFSPSNDAFNFYFANNPNYNSVEDIPIHELTRIVKFHIVQNPWSKIQLRTLDIYGWIDTLDINNNQPKGFKRETLLFEADRKYGVSSVKVGQDDKLIIVDTLESNWNRKAVTDSRKFAPIFFQEYFDIYDLEKSDYEYYFERSFDSPSDIYFAGAKIVSDEIFAENGFVYIVDRVVEPLKNAYSIIEEETKNYKYTDFLDLINLFPDFEYNVGKTFDQPGADQGLLVDSLFDLSYPELTFDINAEKTSPPTGTYGLPQNVTIRYHHGFMAPTNEALESFENEFIKISGGWGKLEGAPDFIKRIIANTYMSSNTIYPSDFEKGFYNGELDVVKLDESNIVQKEFGSNSTFIGLNEAIVPRAFKSVTGPVYLQQGYSSVMYAIEKSGLLPALKRENENYMFFVESTANSSRDSSLVYNASKDQFSSFQISEGGFHEYQVNINDLRTLLLNQIAKEQPLGLARVEFIPNLAGNFIIINNETGEISGTGKTTAGYKGSEFAPEFPTSLGNLSDNGVTYDVKNWFSFSSPSLFSIISTDYPVFHNLLKKAGLTLDKEYRYNFISDNEYYTVFIPGNEAIENEGLNSLPVDELKKLLQFHFVQGDIIFTDGRKSSGYFETTRIDEQSTEFSRYFTNIYINSGIDVINIPDKNGASYVEIIEEKGRTNLLTGVLLGEGGEVFPVMFNNGVVHEIDKVLKVEELDTN